MNPVARREVLIAADDPLTREVFHDVLSAEGYECLLAADGREGIEMFRGWRPPLVLTDVDLPHMDGLELTRAIREEDPEAAVIVLLGTMANQCADVADTAYRGSVRTICLRLGAFMVLEKPVSTDELLLATEGALYSRQMACSQRQLLKYRWGTVRPMAVVAELLAMYGAVFTPPRPPDVTTMPAQPRIGTDVHVDASQPSRQRPSTEVHGQGRSVRCRGCGFSNRLGSRTCWLCYLPLSVNLPVCQVTAVS